MVLPRILHGSLSERWLPNWGHCLGGCFRSEELPAQQYVGGFLSTFSEFPPSQKVGSFSLEKVLESLQTGGNK
jgi:hypothetical protein